MRLSHICKRIKWRQDRIHQLLNTLRLEKKLLAERMQTKNSAEAHKALLCSVDTAIKL